MTSVELSPLAPLVRQLGALYWLLGLLCLALVVWRIRSRVAKLISALVVVALFGVPALLDTRARQIKTDAHRTRLKEAQAHFEARCSVAGEKIARTVDSVDMIAILKNRPAEGNLADQFKMDDPYGRWRGGDNCTAGYIIDQRMVPTGTGSYAQNNKPVYRYVEAIDDATGQWYRHEKASDTSPLVRTPIAGASARYGLTWDDVSTAEDRSYWIAGGSLKVIDLKTGEVVAERVGYLMDPGQGDRSGFRSPWAWARAYGPACPPLRDHNLEFVTKVLRPAPVN